MENLNNENNLNKWIFYVTVNLCNGKLYFGVHRTNPNVFDGYIGNSIYRQNQATEDFPFHRAVRKYGYENFKRTTIKIFPDTEEGKKAAFDLEAVIVNENLLKSKNVYNIALGGASGANLDEFKTIYMYDLKGNYLRSFKGARAAATYLGFDDIYGTMKAIRNNCLGTSKSSFNYYFSYIKHFGYTNDRVVKVAQYTLNGKFLRTWDSISEAERALETCTIWQACHKKCASAGFQWRIFEGDTSDIPRLISVKTKNNIIPINMYKKDGTFVESFESVNACVKKYSELSASQINRVLTNTIKSHKGFVFKYKDEDIV